MTNPNKQPEEQNPYASYLEQLLGYTVKTVIIYASDDGVDETSYGLILSRTDDDGKEQFLYTEILRDEEGNGPGHLHISKDLA
jgi:hypothetical protein